MQSEQLKEEEESDAMSAEENADADREAEDSNTEDSGRPAKRARNRSPTPSASSPAAKSSASGSASRASRKLFAEEEGVGDKRDTCSAGEGLLANFFDGLQFDLRSLRSLGAEEQSKLRRNIIAVGGRVLDDQPSASRKRMPSRASSISSPAVSPRSDKDSGPGSTEVLVVTESTRQQNALSRTRDEAAALTGASCRHIPLEWVCSSIQQRRRLPLLDKSKALDLDTIDL